MSYYCESCMSLHQEDELCPEIKKHLKEEPAFLSKVATFVNVAGQYHLVTSQDLQLAFNRANKLMGTNFQFEGMHQLARDIQVFKRLDVEAFSKLGAFRNASSAQSYLNEATSKQLTNLSAKLSGAGQEVDWLRYKQGQLRAVFEENILLNKNAVGVDGETINRITGGTVSRTTVKAAQTRGGFNTNVRDVVDAIKNETLSPKDIVFGIEGTDKALMNKLAKKIAHAESIGDKETLAKLTSAKQRLTTHELGSNSDVKNSVDRLKSKVSNGQVATAITMEQAAKKMAQGAVIGAAVTVTVSSLTNYYRYTKGEITIEQAFTDVGEDTVKGTIMGGTMAGITLFLPAGAIGFVAGMAIGIYMNEVFTNILDEVFGKGAYLEILTSSGYVMGTSRNLLDTVDKIGRNSNRVKFSMTQASTNRKLIVDKIDNINKILED